MTLQPAGAIHHIFTCQGRKKKFFGVRPMLLELDLSKREVLHLLASLVSSYACEFMTYHHIRDVVASRGYILYFHIPRQKKKFFGDRPMLLELDLSKREVLHLLASLVSSYACEFMTYHHIRDVAAFRDYTSYFHMPRQKKKILWCQVRNPSPPWFGGQGASSMRTPICRRALGLLLLDWCSV